MSISSFPSKLLENAVDEFSRLPGIGKKTALRLVLHILRQPNDDVSRFAQSLVSLKNDIKYCRECNSLSDTDICSICSSPKRNSSILCIVENIRDVMSIESTSQYNGLYYVLGGLISPMDGVGPADLNIDGLVNKIASGTVKEVVMALSATMEGDTTNFYIYKKIKPFDVEVTAIARGVAFGDDLEYADEVTLGRAIVNRVKFENTIAN
ncbi:MAG TPA: recombination mediator RecR [Tenuifilaceae bacterium]|nr:recombination mediator RecR [Tenuifilaceae bacterium]HPE17311.1 recombination mediator RecR [Tenuifilaceae bacterium]HPJ44537.1 recombination mediator RecR [Tenuifilaceae bacterium]HPQ33075.1 recombination mediator RecR [Tenuifilaceae bacterium]HRX67619.1 recombination mediator RecR [Tenuifilaceae bacterium]